jgi:2-polyprenyl-3-methyl-5-hydroxy-6-metoxy-1,4-benzoquinol methylase
MTITFEKNACLCENLAPSVEVTRTSDHNFGRTAERAMILRCSECGSLFPSIFPTAQTLHEAYDLYYTTQIQRGAIKRAMRWLVSASKRNHLLRSTPPAATSVLDYGCGSGEFLRQLARLGRKLRLAGTEINRLSAADLLGFDWIELEALGKGHPPFDWITMNHVVEHVADPKQVLQLLKTTMSPEGGLWIATPNSDAFLTTCFGEFARDLDFPRHRQIFSTRALAAMLEDAGYSVSQLPPPRIDTLLNFLSCVRNVTAANGLSAIEKTLLIGRAVASMLTNLLSANSSRIRTAPEIVLIARSRGAFENVHF